MMMLLLLFCMMSLFLMIGISIYLTKFSFIQWFIKVNEIDNFRNYIFDKEVAFFFIISTLVLFVLPWQNNKYIIMIECFMSITSLLLYIRIVYRFFKIIFGTLEYYKNELLDQDSKKRLGIKRDDKDGDD